MTSLALGLVSACAADGPRIDQVTPPAAPRGARIAVEGAGFCGPIAVGPDGTCEHPPSGSVQLGLELPALRAAVQTWGDDAILVLVPAAAATGVTTVIVTVDGRSSNGARFEVTP